MSEGEPITAYTKHIHVGYLGPERFFPDVFLVVLTNREEGTVNYQFAYNRQEGDFCEMDVIGRVYGEKLVPISEEQYLAIICYGKIEQVIAELGLGFLGMEN